MPSSPPLMGASALLALAALVVFASPALSGSAHRYAIRTLRRRFLSEDEIDEDQDIDEENLLLTP